MLTHEKSVLSFEAVSLFTMVPTSLAIQVAKQRLETDTSLAERSSLAVIEIVTLLSSV